MATKTKKRRTRNNTVTPEHLGTPVKTHHELDVLVKTKRWVVFNSKGIPASSIVNMPYAIVCKLLKSDRLKRYIKHSEIKK